MKRPSRAPRTSKMRLFKRGRVGWVLRCGCSRLGLDASTACRCPEHDRDIRMFEIASRRTRHRSVEETTCGRFPTGRNTSVRGRFARRARPCADAPKIDGIFCPQRVTQQERGDVLDLGTRRWLDEVTKDAASASHHTMPRRGRCRTAEFECPCTHRSVGPKQKRSTLRPNMRMVMVVRVGCLADVAQKSRTTWYASRFGDHGPFVSLISPRVLTLPQVPGLLAPT